MNIRSLYKKVYIVLMLSGVLSCLFLYLLFSGFTNRIDHSLSADVQNSPQPVTAPESTYIPSPTPSIMPASTPEIYDVTSDDSLLRIVNKWHPLASGYIPDTLVIVNVPQYESQVLLPEVYSAIEDMFSKANEEGIHLYLVSGYRDFQYQTDLYDYYVSKFGKQEAERIDCIPGCSEHQTGLSVDLSSTSHKYELDVRFEQTDEYQWLITHCSEFGFILRNPKGKEEITGVKFSPWNFRYVGKEMAQKITDSNLTMEEYFQIIN